MISIKFSCLFNTHMCIFMVEESSVQSQHTLHSLSEALAACFGLSNPSLDPSTRHMAGIMCNDMSTYSMITQKNRTQVLYFDMSLYLLFVSHKGPVMDWLIWKFSLCLCKRMLVMLQLMTDLSYFSWVLKQRDVLCWVSSRCAVKLCLGTNLPSPFFALLFVMLTKIVWWWYNVISVIRSSRMRELLHIVHVTS
jgi:hypothetical protein